MSYDYKKSVQAAVEKFNEKNDPNYSKPTRKNQKPEEEFIHNELVPFLKSINIDHNVIEAKSTFSEKSQRYTMQSVAPGYPDISGNFPNGLALFIEVKAPGCRTRLRDDQREFLIRKINSNCFACVTDSIEHLTNLIEKFKTTDNRKSLLLNDLPLQKEKKDQDLFWD